MLTLYQYHWNGILRYTTTWKHASCTIQGYYVNFLSFNNFHNQTKLLL